MPTTSSAPSAFDCVTGTVKLVNAVCQAGGTCCSGKDACRARNETGTDEGHSYANMTVRAGSYNGKGACNGMCFANFGFHCSHAVSFLVPGASSILTFCFFGDWETFDVDKYEHFEQVEVMNANGGLRLGCALGLKKEMT